MTNRKGNDKQAWEDRKDWETVKFEIEAIIDDADLLPTILDLLKQRYDRPPELLMNAYERAMRIQKAAQVAKAKLDPE